MLCACVCPSLFAFALFLLFRLRLALTHCLAWSPQSCKRLRAVFVRCHLSAHFKISLRLLPLR